MRPVLAVVLLVVVLVFAIARPRRLPEAVAAVPAAGLAVLAGLVTAPDAVRQLARLGPTVGFLAAVLALAALAADAGVFEHAGALAAAASRGRPRRLLLVVFAFAAVSTAVLSLDATVVLLTPVVLGTARRLRVDARPHAYACAHLANAASVLLPVSNLTNLLALPATGLSFARFAALMVLPWLSVLVVEYLVLRGVFAAELAAPARRPAPDVLPAPVFAWCVLAGTLAGFVVSGTAGIAPVWVAGAGAAVLAAHRFARQRGRRAAVAGRLLRAVNLPFLAFVFALGVVVLAVRRAGLDAVVDTLVPAGTGLPTLLAVAALSAALANVVNNLPATLILLPALSDRPTLVLAMLLGVNIGPNLTYVGSLATLLWRRVLHGHGARTGVLEYLRLGALTVPATLLAATVTLWAAALLTT